MIVLRSYQYFIIYTGIVADFNEQDETLVDVVSPYLEGVFDEAKIKTFCDDVMNILHGKGVRRIVFTQSFNLLANDRDQSRKKSEARPNSNQLLISVIWLRIPRKNSESFVFSKITKRWLAAILSYVDQISKP